MLIKNWKLKSMVLGGLLLASSAGLANACGGDDNPATTTGVIMPDGGTSTTTTGGGGGAGGDMTGTAGAGGDTGGAGPLGLLPRVRRSRDGPQHRAQQASSTAAGKASAGRAPLAYSIECPPSHHKR